MNLLRDALLSFCPEAFRRKHRPCSSSSLVTAAIVLGLVQSLICALLLVQRYQHFLVARAHLLADQMNGRPEWVQSGGVAIITFEFFLYPLSLLLLYLGLEGFLRFAAGITASEVVPSLPVVFASRSRRPLGRDGRPNNSSHCRRTALKYLLTETCTLQLHGKNPAGTRLSQLASTSTGMNLNVR